MFKNLAKEINLKKFYWVVSAVFSINMVAGFLYRHFFFLKYLEETESLGLRRPSEIGLSWVWHVLGHMIIAVFAPYCYISWADGKGIEDGFRSGIIIALICSSIVLIFTPYLAIPTLPLWLSIIHIFILNAINGMVSVKIYYKI